jgi:HSP20 family protein
VASHISAHNFPKATKQHIQHRHFATMKLYLPAKRAPLSVAVSHPAVRRATTAYPFAPESLWREQDAMMNKAFARQSSPRYELTNTDEKFEIVVDVPGVKPFDINVSLENDGQILTLSGKRERKQEGFQYSNEFSQSFTLDRTVDTERLTANLSNGVLIVSAPKDVKRLEHAVRKIPIAQNAHEEPTVAQKALENDASAKKEEVIVETVDDKNEESEEVETPKAA